MAPTPPKQTELSNPEAAVRAANEAKEKAERELAAAQRTIAEMQARDLSKTQAGIAARNTVAPGPLPEQFKGVRKYRLRVPHYRQGLYFVAGDIITVTDERPSKTWVPVEERQVTQIVEVEPTPSGRAADQQV